MAEFTTLPEMIVGVINGLAIPCQARARVFTSADRVTSLTLENIHITRALNGVSVSGTTTSKLFFETSSRARVYSMAFTGPCYARMDITLSRGEGLAPFRIVVDGTIEMDDQHLALSIKNGHYYMQRPMRVMPPQSTKADVTLFRGSSNRQELTAALLTDVSQAGLAFLIDRRQSDVMELVPGSWWGMRLSLGSDSERTFTETNVARNDPFFREQVAQYQIQRMEKLNIATQNMLIIGVIVKDPTYPALIARIMQSWVDQDPATQIVDQDPLASANLFWMQLT